jgi:hypothetical protein
MLIDDAAFGTLGSHHDTASVSQRAENIARPPGIGPILSQMWVQ